jgi:hypothetical protein
MIFHSYGVLKRYIIAQFFILDIHKIILFNSKYKSGLYSMEITRRAI